MEKTHQSVHSEPLPVQQRAPVFVIGSARSGTSILSRLIRDYLRISFGTESQFIIRFHKRLHHYGDLHRTQNLKKLLSDIGQERCFKRWKKFGYRFDFDRIFARIEDSSYAGLLDAIFRDLAVHNGMERWGDKTPEYIYDLDTLYRLFPRGKFVHIVRDGRDVALSTFKIHFGAKNIGMAALEWQKQMESVFRFKEQVAPEQFLEIRYEDFLEAPVETFAKLMQYLEIKDPEGSLRTRIEKELPGELMRGNYFKWKAELSKRDQLIFEKVNFRYLQHYRYPTTIAGGSEIRMGEKLFWIIDHRIKQMARLDTWMDNLYKLNMRVRFFRNRMDK